jgi:hypothetical protein
MARYRGKHLPWGGRHFGTTASGERFMTFFDLYIGISKQGIVFRNYRWLRGK